MRRPTIAALLAAASLLAALPSRAAEVTLSEVMERARRQARDVAAAEARREAGSQRLRQAKSYRYPSLHLEEIWINTDSPADVFGLELNQERFSFADFVATDPNDPSRLDNFLTRLEVSLPLYTGGEIGGRVDQARLAEDAASLSAGWVSDRAALAAAEAYLRLSQAREQVELLERSVETVTRHVEVARSYTEQGMLVRSELLRAEVERARIEDLLAEARGQAAIAEANLSFRLAADPDSHWEPRPVPEPRELEEDLAGWLATAEERPDLEAARRLLAAGELEEKVERSGLLPKLALVGRYDWNDDSPFGNHGDASSIMLVAGIDLFSGSRHRAAAAAARAEAEAAAAEVEQFVHGVRLEVEQAYQQATTARLRHRTALEALDAARETARITGERFREGVVKMIDLLDATTAQREAEARELVSRAEAQRAGLELAVRAGRSPESMLPTASSATDTQTSRSSLERPAATTTSAAARRER